nr:uncharacterized protein LOC109167104 [Ipomoea batatas]
MRKGEAEVLGFAPVASLVAAVRAEAVAERKTDAAMLAIVSHWSKFLASGVEALAPEVLDVIELAYDYHNLHQHGYVRRVQGLKSKARKFPEKVTKECTPEYLVKNLREQSAVAQVFIRKQNRQTSDLRLGMSTEISMKDMGKTKRITHSLIIVAFILTLMAQYFITSTADVSIHHRRGLLIHTQQWKSPAAQGDCRRRRLLHSGFYDHSRLLMDEPPKQSPAANGDRQRRRLLHSGFGDHGRLLMDEPRKQSPAAQGDRRRRLLASGFDYRPGSS